MQPEIVPPSLFSWNSVATENMIGQEEEMLRHRTKKKETEALQRRGQ